MNQQQPNENPNQNKENVTSEETTSYEESFTGREILERVTRGDSVSLEMLKFMKDYQEEEKKGLEPLTDEEKRKLGI